MHKSLSTLERFGYLFAVLCIAMSTAIFLPGRAYFAKGQWALLYLLIIGLVAGVSGFGAALLAAVLAFLAWNYFFLPPYHTFAIADPKDWLSLLVFLLVGIAMGMQTARMRQREAEALARESETALLNRLSAQLVSETTTAAMAEALLEEVTRATDADHATLFVPDASGELEVFCVAQRECPGPESIERKSAEWSFREGKAIGLPAVQITHEGWPISVRAGDVMPEAEPNGLFLPLQTSARMEGVLHIGPRRDGVPYLAHDARLLVSIANLAAAFLDRRALEGVATQAEALREADRLKSTLISSVSHELKTPLASVTAAVTGLLEGDVEWEPAKVHEELGAISEDLDRLNDSIADLLDLSRLEANAWRPQKDWYELGEILAGALSKIPQKQRGRVSFSLPEQLPAIHVDFMQWARVLQNLLENALIYSGKDSPVRVGSSHRGGKTRIWVEDEGPGIPMEERERVFEKFYRGSAAAKAPSGTGLGLAVTREIIRSHGGAISIEDAAPHGARFVISLPMEEGTR